MAYTTINKSTDHFNTKLYTGNNNTAHAITGVGFQPDFTWIKARSITKDHLLFDAVRGVTNAIKTNSTAATDTNSEFLQAFGTDGFTVGNQGKINTISATYVSWNWKGGGAGSANTDGYLSSTVSVNQTAGFSIVTYTGDTVSGRTIGHGLNAVPKMIIIKGTGSNSSPDNWCIYHEAMGNTKRLKFNSTDAAATGAGYWNNTSPTSSVFTIGNSSEPNSGNGVYIAYCFAEKTGFSKFGSYTGNGNADGPFLNCGFKPAWVMAKRQDSSSSGAWVMWDNKRSPFNSRDEYLVANDSAAEGSSGTAIDIFSNGWKPRSAGACNVSGGTFVYMAFAEAPLVGTNNIPATAK